MGFIYKITNNINNKSYIGKTERSIEIRYKEHLRHKDYLDLPLYRAFNKYGVENFSVSQIEECDNKDLDNREIYWINYYKTYLDGYNCTAGGEGGIKTYEEDIEEIIVRYQAGERLDLLCKEYHIYQFSRFHVYVLVYIFSFFLTYFIVYGSLQVHHITENDTILFLFITE